MSSPYDPHPIDHSIAYSNVCSWANGESQAKRPKPEILDKALKHAQFLEDFHIIRKIREAYAIWGNVNETPTPRGCLPPPTPQAIEVDEELTLRFQVFRRPSCEVQLFETLRGEKRATQAYSRLMDEDE